MRHKDPGVVGAAAPSAMAVDARGGDSLLAVPTSSAAAQGLVGPTVQGQPLSGRGGGLNGSTAGRPGSMAGAAVGADGRPRSRKLVIKPFKEKPKLPEGFEEATWGKVQDAVGAIYEKRAVACSLEELYRAVESMCVHKMGAQLYTRLEAECERHICRQLAQLAAQGASLPDPVLFLGHVAAAWDKHCEDMLLIRSIALYLDRTYVMQTSGVKSLWDMGLHLFRRHLERAGDTERRTVAGLLKLIEMERSGEGVDRSVLKRLLEMLMALGVYGSTFLNPLLEQTQEYYRQESQQRMATLDVREYLRRAEARLAEEQERCVQLSLDSNTTRKPLLAAVERQLLQQHAPAIVEKGFNMLMDGGHKEDLQRLYVLMSRVGVLELVRGALMGYVKQAGQGLVMDEDKDRDMVQLLLELKGRVDAVWEQCFAQHDAFANAIKDAFEHLINLRQNRPAELIAKFIDSKLRSGNKGTSDEELEGVLDKVLVLFRFIQGKDVFEAFYKKDLAKRLLFGKSASTDAEKSMISKLKTECGSQFTNKLEGMFKDIELSKEINESFRVSALARQKLPQGIEMNVNVLKMGFWPTYPPMDVSLPRELSLYQDVFKDFYVAKHSGRRLMWQHSLGQCVLKAEFPRGRKELSVSLFQGVVLMLFNDCDRLSLGEVREGSGVTNDAELRRTLQSLACGKSGTRVLQKIPKGRDVEDGDAFEFNSEFSAPLYRIKVNAIQMKETVEENASTTERVFQDRQYQVDAAIVRIMKTRKVLSHTLLITELFQQLKFPVKPADLKKRIESLIDREYMERDKTNPQIYNYVA